MEDDARSVLVVDDDRLVRMGVHRILANDGFKVIEAEDGEHALLALETLRPAAVALDLEMPRLSGREVLVAIRRKYPDLPVVIVSGSITPEVEKGLLSAGARACVKKTDIAERLAPALRRAMNDRAQPPSPLASPGRVLVVDDDERNVRLLDAILTAAGYEVLTAKNGPESLVQVGGGKPDLILLDVMMPGMSGLEVCRLLKENPGTRDIPVVMVTAMADRKDHERAIEAGADDFVTKPVDKGELLLRLKSLLRIKRYADENRELEGLKKDLIGMIVHDLSNPLGVVSGALNFVLETMTSSDEDVMQSLRDAHQACSDAQSLVMNMLDLARFERSTVEPKPESFDVVGLANEVARLQRHYPGAQIDVSVAGDVPAAFADVNLSRRVLTNLLENALRHSPEECTVTLSVARHGPAIQVGVQDSGRGIPPELHAQIFEKFRQGGDGHERVGRLGLGLAFCKLAVEAQQGTIWVESSGQGGGARFNFTLPVAVGQR